MMTINEVKAILDGERPILVVRCKDCKHNNHCLTQEFAEEESKIPFDKNTWFCEDGEQKDGADDE